MIVDQLITCLQRLPQNLEVLVDTEIPLQKIGQHLQVKSARVYRPQQSASEDRKYVLLDV